METPSTMIPLGTALPKIELPDVAGNQKLVDLADTAQGKKGLFVAFVCNHCPYVKHIRKELVKTANEASAEGIAVAFISSNDPAAYPEDGPESMAELAREEGWKFPYLFDESQEAAKAMNAACTPDLYLFDSNLKLAYRGQFDDSRPGNGKPVTGSSFREALRAVSNKQEFKGVQKPSSGCNIKWKPGKEPKGGMKYPEAVH